MIYSFIVEINIEFKKLSNGVFVIKVKLLPIVKNNSNLEPI